MMKRIFVPLLCFFLLLFSVSSAEDRGHGVEVRSTSPELLETQPGKIVTGSFLVSNHTEREEELFEKLTLPAGWQEIVSDEFTLKLKAEEQQVRVVAFLVPRSSPAGRYQISYSVRSQRDLNIADSDTIAVVVLPVIKLEILVEEKPEVVIAGEAYEVRLRLISKGNCKIDVRLQMKSNPDYPVTMEPSEITLEAGKSQIIRLEVKTYEEVKKRIKNILEIKAQTGESRFGVVSVRQTVAVEIIPKVTGEFDPYHRLPVQAALIGAGQDGKSGLQAEFSGSGSLDEDGIRRLDFLFRGPDIQDRSTWRRRDEFRIRYQYKHLDLHFGDRSYSLSPLTQRFSYSRGAQANIRYGEFGFGAFYSENRWGKPKTRKVGTYLAYQFNEKFDIKGNFLSKNKESTPSFRGYHVQIYSIQAEIKANEKTHLGLECGFNHGEREGKLSDLAFRMDLRGLISNRIWYSFEKTHAGPKYFGYYNDADYTSGTITFPIYRKLRGNLFYRSYKNNLDLDSTTGTANREKSYRARIFYSFPFGTSVSLDYGDLIREDYMLPAKYNYEEKAWKLGLAHTFRKLNLSTYMERGKFEDNLSAITNDDLERYSLYAHFRPSSNQTYSLYARIGPSSFTASPERIKSVGLSTSWHIKDDISFSLNYRRDESGSEGSQKRSDISSTLSYTLPNNHALVLRCQWSKYQRKKKGEFSFFAMYTLPLKIPVSKKKSIGVLKGKVYDDEKPQRPPIPEVILTVHGATAITNENGEFVFPSLKPGAYYLGAERSSIGLNRIPNEKLPIMIEVKGGETVEIEVGVLTSCRISGRVAIFAQESDKKFGDQATSSKDSLFLVGSGEEEGPKEDVVEKGTGLGNILVEITDGKEVLRQSTDQKGRFYFEEIRPGTWTLKVYDYDLPAHHYLEEKEFLFELKPGEEKEVTVRVLPRLRPIQIIEEGEIE
jgi:hypothetical protein